MANFDLKHYNFEWKYFTNEIYDEYDNDRCESFLKSAEEFANANMDRYLKFSEQRQNKINNYCEASNFKKWLMRRFDRKIYDDVTLCYQVEFSNLYKECKKLYEDDSAYLESFVYVPDYKKSLSQNEKMKDEAISRINLLRPDPNKFKELAIKLDRLREDAKANTNRFFPGKFYCRLQFLKPLSSYAKTLYKNINRLTLDLPSKCRWQLSVFIKKSNGFTPDTFDEWKERVNRGGFFYHSHTNGNWWKKESDWWYQQKKQNERAWHKQYSNSESKREQKAETQSEEAEYNYVETDSKEGIRLKLFGILERHNVIVAQPETDTNIKKAFKQLALRIHPDKNPEYADDLKVASNCRDRLGLNR